MTPELSDILNRLQICVLACETIQANPQQAAENEVRAINIRKQLMKIAADLRNNQSTGEPRENEQPKEA